MNQNKVHVSHNSYFFPTSTKSSSSVNLARFSSLPERLSSLPEINTTKTGLSSPKVPSFSLKRFDNLESLVHFLPTERNLTPYSVSRSLVTPYSDVFDPQQKASPLSVRSVSSFDVTEENNLRKNKVERILQELVKYDPSSAYMKTGEFEGIYYHGETVRRNKTESFKKIFGLFEQILCLYELKFKVITSKFTDSFLDIDAISDNFTVIEYIQQLAPIICKFPYSFFRRIRFPVITFCEDYFLHKPSTSGHGEVWVLAKGLFPIKRFDEPEKAVDHFMQILYIILKNATPDFEAKVMNACPNMSNNTTRGTTSSNSLARVTRTRIIIKAKTKEEKEWRILKALIMNPSSALAHENETFRVKAALFKGFIGEIDPEGINSKWWSKLGFYTIPSIQL